MAVVDQALSNFWSLVNQWKNGQCAQFVLSCEKGNLTVKTSVSLGSWIPPKDANSRGRLRKVGPSRYRRRVKQAAARAATDLSHLKVTILEQVKFKSTEYRKEREKYFINKFNTLYEGLNRQP